MGTIKEFAWSVGEQSGVKRLDVLGSQEVVDPLERTITIRNIARGGARRKIQIQCEDDTAPYGDAFKDLQALPFELRIWKDGEKSTKSIEYRKNKDGEQVAVTLVNRDQDDVLYVTSSYHPQDGGLMGVTVGGIPREGHRNRRLPLTLEGKVEYFSEKELVSTVHELKSIVGTEGFRALVPVPAPPEVTDQDLLGLYNSILERELGDSFSSWSKDQVQEAREYALVAAGKVLANPFHRTNKETLRSVVDLISAGTYVRLPQTFPNYSQEKKWEILKKAVAGSIAESLAYFYQGVQDEHAEEAYFSPVDFPESSVLGSNFKADFLYDDNQNVVIRVANNANEKAVEVTVPQKFHLKKYLAWSQRSERWRKVLRYGPKLLEAGITSRNVDDSSSERTVKIGAPQLTLLFSSQREPQWDKERGIFVENSGGHNEIKAIYTADGKLAGKLIQKEVDSNGAEKTTSRAFFFGKDALEEYSRSYGLAIHTPQLSQTIEVVSVPQIRRQVTVELDARMSGYRALHVRGSYIQHGPSNIFPFGIGDVSGLPLSLGKKVGAFKKRGVGFNLQELVHSGKTSITKSEQNGDNLATRIKRIFPYWGDVDVSALVAEVRTTIGLATTKARVSLEGDMLRQLEKRIIAKVFLQERMPSHVPETFYRLPVETQVAFIEEMFSLSIAELLAEQSHMPVYTNSGEIMVGRGLKDISLVPKQRLSSRMRFGKKYPVGDFAMCLEDVTPEAVAVGITSLQGGPESVVLLRADIIKADYDAMLDAVRIGKTDMVFPISITN